MSPGVPQKSAVGRPWTNQVPVEGRNTAMSVSAVAVVVAGHGDVAGGAERHRDLAVARTRCRWRAGTRRCRWSPSPS